MKAVIFSLLMISCAVSAKESPANCLATALYRECSGCTVRGQKAVLEVIENLQQIEHKTACQIIMSSKFPWSSSQISWKPSKEALTVLFRARMMSPVVGKNVVYFNTEKQSYGRFAVKIENHYFNYKS